MPVAAQRVFNPDNPLTVLRPFTSHGRQLKAGEPFEWRSLGIDQDKVRILFDGRLLGAATLLEHVPTSTVVTPKLKRPYNRKPKLDADGQPLVVLKKKKAKPATPKPKPKHREVIDYGGE